jgi:uncharacterized phage-associated protein
MNTNALSVANYFVELASKEGLEVRQYGLIKRVYITHGFTLAYYDRPALDPRFDRVEAWKNGPVIPSVYHSFKHNRNNPITEPCIIMDYRGEGEGEIKTPILYDEEIQEIAEGVWEAYKDISDSRIMELLHREGTPWSLCYEYGKTNEIPDLYTKVFYRRMVKKTEERKKQKS